VRATQIANFFHQVVDILERVFSKPVKVKYGNIHLLAILVSALYRYHQDFVISVVDNILEQITLGLEQNDFKFNQKRVAEVKYLGELYNYKMIDSPVVFDTLYRIVTFGYGKHHWIRCFLLLTYYVEGGTPIPGKLNPLDLPDDFFRIRLVCTLLDTCGHCFDRGSAKKKLDFFLIFFQVLLLSARSSKGVVVNIFAVLLSYKGPFAYGRRILGPGHLRYGPSSMEVDD
jgi:regulator of nonsense transcripts 2